MVRGHSSSKPSTRSPVPPRINREEVEEEEEEDEDEEEEGSELTSSDDSINGPKQLFKNSTQGKNCRGLPKHIQKLLLVDIEARGGIQASYDTRSLYNSRSEYNSTTEQRRKVRNKVYQWKKLSSKAYYNLLDSYSIRPGKPSPVLPPPTPPRSTEKAAAAHEDMSRQSTPKKKLPLLRQADDGECKSVIIGLFSASCLLTSGFSSNQIVFPSSKWISIILSATVKSKSSSSTMW